MHNKFERGLLATSCLRWTSCSDCDSEAFGKIVILAFLRGAQNKNRMFPTAHWFRFSWTFDASSVFTLNQPRASCAFGIVAPGIGYCDIGSYLNLAPSPIQSNLHLLFGQLPANVVPNSRNCDANTVGSSCYQPADYACLRIQNPPN